jgi:glycosyltransferase involved in cell wall biosynthesis
MRILFLTRYGPLGASSRQRCYQYLQLLMRAGAVVEVSPLLNDFYVKAIYSDQKIDYLEVARSYVMRVCALLRAQSYDLLWIEKEALPWLPAWLEMSFYRFVGVKFVLDFDDPIFHAYSDNPNWLARRLLGRKVARLMSTAEMVIVGNRYIEDYARANEARLIARLPTVVDIDRYAACPAQSSTNKPFFTIGWIGSPLTSGYLELVRPALLELAARLPLNIVLIGAAPSALAGLPVEHRMWSAKTEAEELAGLDVGIMPLPDRPWERGKCGYKLIQYMASWLPVVASPVGANGEIVEPGVTGFLADSHADWISALLRLWEEPELRRKMGIAGRRRAEERYSLQVATPQLMGLLRNVAVSMPEEQPGQPIAELGEHGYL